ncbi:MAG: DUF3558 family protein [Mycobacteriales bacterium]
MTARRTLAGLALLLAVPAAAACARVVPGSGTLADDVQVAGPTGSSAPSPSDGSGSSTLTPSPSASGSVARTSPVCEALDQDAVESAFGTSVTFGRSQGSGCQIRADDGRSMVVAVFDYLKLSEYRRPDSTELTVGGYPAVRTSATILYVGRSKDPAAAGLLAAYFGGLRDGGEPIATRVLELLIPQYAR